MRCLVGGNRLGNGTLCKGERSVCSYLGQVIGEGGERIFLASFPVCPIPFFEGFFDCFAVVEDRLEEVEDVFLRGGEFDAVFCHADGGGDEGAEGECAVFGGEGCQAGDDAWDGAAGASDVEQVLGGSVVGGDGVEVHVGVGRRGGHVDEEVVDLGFVGADVADEGDAAAADAGHGRFGDEGGKNGCDGCVDGVAALGENFFSGCDGLFVSACDDAFHGLAPLGQVCVAPVSTVEFCRCVFHRFMGNNLVSMVRRTCFLGLV